MGMILVTDIVCVGSLGDWQKGSRCNSIIKFFVLDRLLPWVVAVSTDPAQDSALPHPSSLGQSASYRNAIVRGLLRLVRLKLSSLPMGLERAPMAWRRPCFLENLHPL